MHLKIGEKWYQYQAKCFHLSRCVASQQNSVEKLMRKWSVANESELGSTQRHGEIFIEGSDLFCSSDWSLVQFFLQRDADGNDYRLFAEDDDTENLQPLCYKLFPYWYWNTGHKVVVNVSYGNASYWMCERKRRKRERESGLRFHFMGVRNYEKLTVQDTNRHIHFEKMKCSYAYMMPMVHQTVRHQMKNYTTLSQHRTEHKSKKEDFNTLHHGVPLSHQLFNSAARWYCSATASFSFASHDDL